MSLEYLRINSSLNWQQTDFVNDALVLEQGKLEYSNSLTSGTGIGQVNKAYYDVGTLSTGQNLQFDLINLNRSILGHNLLINFSGDNVKLVVIENKSTGIGDDLFVCSTGAGGITQIFGYGYLGWHIKPQSYSIFCDRNLGYPVNTGERYFYLYDISGRAPSYEVGIFGVTFD